jgi:ABC-type lipoprotein release transport system permease subunit
MAQMNTALEADFMAKQIFPILSFSNGFEAVFLMALATAIAVSYPCVRAGHMNPIKAIYHSA